MTILWICMATILSSWPYCCGYFHSMTVMAILWICIATIWSSWPYCCGYVHSITVMAILWICITIISPWFIILDKNNLCKHFSSLSYIRRISSLNSQCHVDMTAIVWIYASMVWIWAPYNGHNPSWYRHDLHNIEMTTIIGTWPP